MGGWTVKVGRFCTECSQCSFTFISVCQLFKRLDQDEVQTATASVRQDFHYSKVGPDMQGSEVTSLRWAHLVFFVSPSHLAAAEETK